LNTKKYWKMTRKDKIESVDKYLSGELTGDALRAFNKELASDPALAEEARLQNEIQEAVMETGIMALRESLQSIAKQGETTEIGAMAGHEGQAFSFGLSEEMSSFKEFNQPVNFKDIASFGKSLPKIHLAQHNIASKENIHQFYKEQQQHGTADYSGMELSPGDEEIFAGVQASMEEKDIQDLRANLQQIAASVPAHQRTAQEIEEYNNNWLDSVQLAAFEQEMLMSKGLAKDVQMFRDIDLAAAETDIMDLRASLQSIHQTEASTPQKIEGIDQYLNGELAGGGLAEFEAELSNNPGLAAELELYAEIDRAIMETGVMGLREKLGAIGRETKLEEKQKRSIIARTKPSRLAIATIAASLVLALGIAGLMGRHKAPASGPELYGRYYSPYQATGIFRSGDALVDSKLAKALGKFDAGQYQAAIELFGEVLQVDKNNPVGNFYSGMAFQQTGQPSRALGAYTNVVRDRDNLFIEQAQWYIGLCYLQAENREKAYQQFKKIAKSDSFYQEKASAILRKIEHLE
jgi:tetratricopeptide (TPR) repeat protein